MLTTFFLNLFCENFFLILPVTIYIFSNQYAGLNFRTNLVSQGSSQLEQLFNIFKKRIAIFFKVALSWLAVEDFIFFLFLTVAILSFMSELLDLFDAANNSFTFTSHWNPFLTDFSAAPVNVVSTVFTMFGTDALVDSLSFLLAFLGVVVTISSDEGTADDRSDSNHSIFLFFLFQILLDLSLSTTDLLIFFVCFEMLTIPMFLFFAICGSRDRRMRAFNYFFWYTVFGSVPFLLGILYMKALSGSTNYEILSNYLFTPSEQIVIWALLAPAIIFKVPLCPFHLWLPEAHVEASTNVSIFLAGILLKIGGYAYIRFLIGFVPLGNLYFLDFINVIAIISSCWPAFSALWQADLKRIIAYMSIAHMAVAILSLNTYTIVGFYSALYNFISHGIISAALFLLVGILYESYKTRHIWYYSGLATTMPLFTLYFLFFMFCNIGFPGSSAFVAELTAFISLANVSLILLFFVLFGAFLLVIANLWLVHILFGAPNLTYIKNYKDIEFWSGDHFALITLAIALLVVGLFPEYLFILFENLSDYYFFRFVSF